MLADVAQPARSSYTAAVRRAGALLVSALLVSALLGCSGGRANPGVDAGADGGADTTAPAPCFGAQICQGDVVHACRDGKVGDALEACPGPCSLGRCATAACAMAESNRTGFVGCLFYVFEADNVTADAPLPTSLLVANPSSTTAATVTQQLPLPGGSPTTWTFDTQVIVSPGQAGRLFLIQDQVQGGGTASRAGFRLISDQPVTVALIQSDDRDQSMTTSSAGTMVLPAQSLGAHYRVMTYRQQATPAVADTVGGLGGAGRITIVGTQPDTHVAITLSATAAGLATSPAQPLDPITLGDGDVFQLYSAAEGSDLTGTEILADLPVAVFSGNMTTTYGEKDRPGVNSPDMVHEQMPPLGAWSRRWVAAALPPQEDTCNTLLGTLGASIWRILASENDTSVTFDGPASIVDLPTSPIALAAGEAFQIKLSGGSFKVTATNAVLVTQGIDCEPSLSLAVSLDRLLDDLTFAVLPNFDQLMAVVRPARTPITLDGPVINDAAFAPAGAGYEVAQIPIPACPISMGVCTHHLTGRFGMTLRGMDVLSSYALTAPTFAGCVDLADPTCVP